MGWGPSTLCAALDANDPALEIDLIPAEREDIPTLETRVHIHNDD